MIEVPNINLEQVPPEFREIVKIKIIQNRLAQEFVQMIQKYTLPGLDDPSFWKKEMETIETYKKLRGWQ